MGPMGSWKTLLAPLIPVTFSRITFPDLRSPISKDGYFSSDQINLRHLSPFLGLIGHSSADWSNHKRDFLKKNFESLSLSLRQLTSAIVRPFQWVIINLGNIHFYNISICLFKLLLCTKVEIGEINSQSQYKDDYKSSLFIGLLGNETFFGATLVLMLGSWWSDTLRCY